MTEQKTIPFLDTLVSVQDDSTLVHPKDIVLKGKKTSTVYRAVCGVCGDDYVGETKQPLVKKAHQDTHPAAGRPNLEVLDPMGDTGHKSFEILEKEDWRR